MLPAAVVSALIKVDGIAPATRQLESFSSTVHKSAGVTEHLTTVSEKVKPSADKASEGVRGFGKASESAGSSIKHMVTGLLAAGGAFAAYEGVKRAIGDTIELGNSTQRLTSATGLDTKTASEWINVMKVRGQSTTSTDRMFISLSRNIRNAEAGSKTAVKAFHELGVPMADIRKENLSQVMSQVADGFKNTVEPTHRAALAQQLFGVGTQTLIPVLRSGSKGIDELLNSAHKYGAYLPNNTKELRKAITASDNWHLTIIGLQTTITSALLPALLNAAGHIEKFVGQMRSGKGAGGDFKKVLEGVWDAAKKVAKWIGDALKVVGKLYGEFKKANPIVVTITGAVIGLALAFKGLRTAVALFDIVAGIADVIAAPWILLAVAIGALVGAFVLLYIKVKPVRDILNRIGHAIGIVFKTGVNIAKAVIKSLIGIVKGTFEGIKGVIELFSGIFSGNFHKMWGGIKKIFHGGLTVIVSIIKGFWGIIYQAGLGLGKSLGHGLRHAIQDAVNWVISKVDWLVNAFNNTVGRITGSITPLSKVTSIDPKNRNIVDASGRNPQTPAEYRYWMHHGGMPTQKDMQTPAEKKYWSNIENHTKNVSKHLSDAAGHAKRIATVMVPIPKALMAPVHGIHAVEGKINAIDQKRLEIESKITALTTTRDSLENNLLSARTLGAKDQIKHELQINAAKIRGLHSETGVLSLRKAGLELELHRENEAVAAQKKAAEARKKAEEARKKAREAERKHIAWIVAVFGHLPSQSGLQQIRMTEIQNRLTGAQTAGNVGGQKSALDAEKKLDKEWLAMDKKKLRAINKQLKKRGLPKQERRGLIQDKLAVLQEIGNIEADLGTVASSLASLDDSSTTDTSGFDLAPTGGSVVNPTAYDVRSQIPGPKGGVHHHHHHHGNVTVNVNKGGDEKKVYDALDRVTGGSLHARVRRAGLRGT